MQTGIERVCEMCNTLGWGLDAPPNTPGTVARAGPIRHLTPNTGSELAGLVYRQDSKLSMGTSIQPHVSRRSLSETMLLQCPLTTDSW